MRADRHGRARRGSRTVAAAASAAGRARIAILALRTVPAQLALVALAVEAILLFLRNGVAEVTSTPRLNTRALVMRAVGAERRCLRSFIGDCMPERVEAADADADELPPLPLLLLLSAWSATSRNFAFSWMPKQRASEGDSVKQANPNAHLSGSSLRAACGKLRLLGALFLDALIVELALRPRFEFHAWRWTACLLAWSCAMILAGDASVFSQTGHCAISLKQSGRPPQQSGGERQQAVSHPVASKVAIAGLVGVHSTKNLRM